MTAALSLIWRKHFLYLNVLLNCRHSRPLFRYFRHFRHLIEIADDWIRTTYAWWWKQLLYHLRHNRTGMWGKLTFCHQIRHQIKLNWPVLLYWFILLKFIGLNISNWHSRWLKIAFYFSFVWLFSSRWFGTRRSKTKKFWFFVYNFAMLLLLIQFDLVYISCKNNLEDYTSGWQYSTILWQFIFYVDCLFKAIPQTTNHP